MTDQIQQRSVVARDTGRRIGCQVVLGRESRYLAERHGAVAGSVGVIVRHSRLDDDDDGVLVDVGDGLEVRSNRDELMLASPDLKIVTRSFAWCAHCAWASELAIDPRQASAEAEQHHAEEHRNPIDPADPNSTNRPIVTSPSRKADL